MFLHILQKEKIALEIAAKVASIYSPLGIMLVPVLLGNTHSKLNLTQTE
jgi:hypothetical protein